MIDEVYVSSGDAVQAGDLLASVEESSLTGVLQSLQSSIDSVDEELEAALEDSEEETELTSSLSAASSKSTPRRATAPPMLWRSTAR